MIMRLDLDESLLREAMRLGHHSTRKSAVHEALTEYVRLRRATWASESVFREDWDNPADADYDAFQGGRQ